MTLEETIKRYKKHSECIQQTLITKVEAMNVYGWLKELKAYRELADWLVKAVLEEDWEESADFYAEVLCRKLTKLGKLKVVDNKYMEVKK